MSDATDSPTTLTEPVVLDLDALEATARAASQGFWETEQSDEYLTLNKGSALTEWNEAGTVGTPARSWRSVDRIVEIDIEDLEDAEINDLGNDLDHIAAARPEVVLALIERLRAAEAVTPEKITAGIKAHHDTLHRNGMGWTDAEDWAEEVEAVVRAVVGPNA